MKRTATMGEILAVIPNADNEEVGSLLNTGTLKYYSLMRSHIDGLPCGFCVINPNMNIVLLENEFWRLWDNPVGKDSGGAVERHLVIPFKGSHLTDISDLPKGAGEAFFDIVKEAKEKFSLPGGAIITRFGEVRRNGGSMRHIHGNIKVMAGDKSFKETFAKSADDLLKKGAKILIWEKLYQLGKNGHLNPEITLSNEERAFLAE